MSDSCVTDLTRGVYRRLYSGFTKGQRINKLTLQAEAWFWRILATVDDFGNADADPELCRAATVGRRPGITTKQISAWLREMQQTGLIEFYGNNKGESFLHVVGFEVSQPSGKNGRRIRRVDPPGESKGIQDNPDVVSASDSEEEDDSDSDSEKVVSRGKPRSTRTVKFCDEEYLEELQTKPAYQKLDVKHVHAKMVVWCENKGKQPTRGRLINWLNNEDQPMEIANGTNRQHSETASERRARTFKNRLAIVAELRGEGSGDSNEGYSGERVPA